ncbi:hypothetical protein, conserved [Eimeria brunetti]|uniref:Uncharacterized protein n=1 Tax=Eimeria brunetti TaxID=51314 RepID=U6LR51_9EIME|nr:hypothetical protein, conserved [Eimeria brunetti]
MMCVTISHLDLLEKQLIRGLRDRGSPGWHWAAATFAGKPPDTAPCAKALTCCGELQQRTDGSSFSLLLLHQRQRKAAAPAAGELQKQKQQQSQKHQHRSNASCVYAYGSVSGTSTLSSRRRQTNRRRRQGRRKRSSSSTEITTTLERDAIEAVKADGSSSSDEELMREKDSEGSDGRKKATCQNDGENPDVDSLSSNSTKRSSSSIRSRHERLLRACHTATGKVALLFGKQTNEQLKSSSRASKQQQKTAAAPAVDAAPQL